MTNKKEIVKKTTKKEKPVSQVKGRPTLACFFGLHAWVDGVCINCGKKRY